MCDGIGGSALTSDGNVKPPRTVAGTLRVTPEGLGEGREGKGAGGAAASPSTAHDHQRWGESGTAGFC